MDVKSSLFYLFSLVLVFAAFRVITVRNPVYAVLYLVLAFFQAAGVWMLLKAEFLSITLVLVYVGAVMVLFLFVVMMLDINPESLRRGFWKHFPFAAALLVLIIVQMGSLLLLSYPETEALPMRGLDGMPLPPNASNTAELGRVLYTHYLFPLEIAAVLLLVAIISAIALTMRKRKDSKAQSVPEQLRAKPEDRVRLVSMPVTQPAPVAATAEEASEEKKA